MKLASEKELKNELADQSRAELTGKASSRHGSSSGLVAVMLVKSLHQP